MIALALCGKDVWLKRMSNYLIKVITFYQKFISPLFGPHCRFHPMCSVYAQEAIKEHGVFRGLWLSLKRISKCHPFGGHGLDPVPPGK